MKLSRYSKQFIKLRFIKYTALDISISFLAFRYPKKLIKHLRDERNLEVEKSSPGIYYINKETFKTQIIVISELSPEKYLYLRCLTDNFQDISLINRLADDYANHKNHDIYTKYLNQLTIANSKTKGELSMVCEGLFNLFGTSSEEIIAHAKKESDDYYLPQLNKLSSQNNYLKNLLIQNNIAFDLSSVSNKTDLLNQ